MWDASKCDLCGNCLVKCCYVDYDKDEAVSEIKLLMEGKAADIRRMPASRMRWCLLLAEYDPLKAKWYHKLFTGPLAFSAPQPVGVSHRRDPRLSPGRPPEK